MLGNLPKTLDRDYLVGYFLPALVLVAALAFLADRFGLLAGVEIWNFVLANSYLGTAIAVFIIWILSASLMAANGWILRCKEGYMWRRLLTPMSRLERKLYRHYRCRHLKAHRKIRRLEAAKAPVGSEILEEWIYTKRVLATRFPDDEQAILPWSFGNTVRAFERYSLKMYGLDAIAGWSRLLGVMPASYRALVDSAKAQTDFLLNLWTVWWALLLTWIGLAILRSPEIVWFPVVALLCIWSSSALARGAALRWGGLVKSAFDVFLHDLRDRLGLTAPISAEEERRMWRLLSRAFLYGDEKALEEAYKIGRPEQAPRDESQVLRPKALAGSS